MKATIHPIACVEQFHLLFLDQLARILQARGLTITRCSAPKQTETTQRWKLELAARGVALPLYTRIEVSRRGISEPLAFEPVDGAMIREYQLTPVLATHYPAEAAFRQKIHALIHRRQTQARDVFDLDHLLRSGVSVKGMSLPTGLRDAQQHAMAVSFDVFKSQVLSFLAPEYRARYDDSGMWDDIVLRVVEALKGDAS